MVRSMFKIIVIVCAALCGLLIIIGILLVNPPGEDAVRGWLEQRFSEDIGLPVTIGRFETNLLTRVQLAQLLIRSPQDSDTLLYISDLHVGYSIPRLLGKSIDIHEIVVDSLIGSLSIDSAGLTGIPILDSGMSAAPDTRKPSPGLSAGRVSVGHIQVNYRDDRLPMETLVQEGSLSVTGTGPEEYWGSLEISTIKANYDGMIHHLDEFRVVARLQSNTFTLDTARAVLDGLTCMSHGYTSLAAEKEISLDLVIEGSPDSLLSILRPYYDLPELRSDSVSAMVRATQTLSAPQITGSVTFSRSQIDALEIPQGHLQVSAVTDTVYIDTMALSLLDGNLSGHGLMCNDTIRYTSFSLAVDGLNLGKCWQVMQGEPPPYQGTVVGTVTIEGPLSNAPNLKTAIDVRLNDLVYQTKSLPDLVVRMTSDHGRVQARIQQGADIIEGSFQLSTETLSGEFLLDIPNVSSLASLIDQPGITGQCLGSGTVGGTLGNPRVVAVLAGDNWQIHNFPIDSLRTQIRFQDSALTIVEARFDGNLREIDSARPPFAIPDVTGTLEYHGEVHGNLDSLSGFLAASAQELRWTNYGADSVLFRGEISGAEFTMPTLAVYYENLLLEADAMYDTSENEGTAHIWLSSMVGPDSTLEDVHAPKDHLPLGSLFADFRITGQSTFACQVTGKDVELALVNHLNPELIPIEGRMDFAATADGGFSRPKVQLQSTMRNIRFGEYRVDSVLTTATIDPERLKIDTLTLHTAGQSIIGQGSVALSQSEDGGYRIDDDAQITGTLGIDEFNIASLQPFIAPVGDIAGEASGQITLRGTLRDPYLNGWLRLVEAYVLLDEQSEPVENIFISLTFADTTARIDSLTFRAGGIPGTLSGSAAIESLKKFRTGLELKLAGFGSLSADGWISADSLAYAVTAKRFDLAVLQPFATDIDSLAGILTASLQLKGNVQMPEVTGSVSVADFSASAEAYSMTIDHGRLAARFDREHIFLDSLTADVNGGTIAVHGEVTHDAGELKEMRLQFDADSLTLRDPDVYSAKIQRISLLFHKQDELHILDGDIAMGEARLTAGFKPQSILPWVQGAESVEWELPELIARTRLNIRFRESDQLWVDNNLARIRLHAAVTVIGTPVRPNLCGMVIIKEGYLLYLDRRFKVSTGTVYFADPASLNPEINLKASTQVTSYSRTMPTTYDIHIRAEGTVDQLQFGLKSDPPLDRPDIVALLTVGATRTELTRGSGESNGAGLKNVLAERGGWWHRNAFQAMCRGRRVRSLALTIRTCATSWATTLAWQSPVTRKRVLRWW